MIRLFVGIALPPELCLRLSLLCTGIPGARWVDPGNFHVTLRFIGEVDEGTASDIDAALAAIVAPRFSLTLAGMGHFGGHHAGGKPRLLWAGIAENPALVQLHDKVERALIRIGIPPDDRKYAPHVSLARLKDVTLARLEIFLQANALFRAPPFAVDRFSLIASTLTKSGAIYEDAADYRLR